MALGAAEAAAAGVLRWVAKGLEFILSAVAGMFVIRCICLKWMRFLLVCLGRGMTVLGRGMPVQAGMACCAVVWGVLGHECLVHQRIMHANGM